MVARAEAELVALPAGHDTWNVRTVLDAALRDRDPRAQRIIDEAREAACTLVANACTLLNPAAVVLGGGVLAGWPALFGDIERFVAGWCRPEVVAPIRFVPSSGGSDAVLQGAAVTAWSME